MVDPYADPDEPILVSGPTIRESIVKLLTNWGKNSSKATIDLWTEVAIEESHTPEQIAAGVKASIRKLQGDNAPQGWSKFSQYIPAQDRAERSTSAWWGEDGDWGGDWSGIGRSGVLYVAAIFWVGMRPCEAIVEELIDGEDGKRILSTHKETRPSCMGDRAKARTEEFLKMAYRRRTDPITEGDVMQAVNALNEGGTAGLRRFVGNPSKYADMRTDRISMAEGIRAIRERDIVDERRAA